MLRPVVLLFCFCTATGCATTSWSATQARAVELEASKPEALRLALDDGTTAVVYDPTVRPDSILGRTEAGPFAVAAAAVTGVEVQERHLTRGGRTAVAVVVGAAALAALALRVRAAVSW